MSQRSRTLTASFAPAFNKGIGPGIVGLRRIWWSSSSSFLFLFRTHLSQAMKKARPQRPQDDS